MFLIALLGGPVLFSQNRYLQIRTVEISGNSVVTSEAIAATAQTALAGNYARLFSRANIFFYPKGALEKKIREQFPRIARIAVDLELGRNVLTLSIEEREPAAVWCGGEVSSQSCYFIDKEGFAFDAVAEVPPRLYFVYISELPGKVLGIYPIERKLFANLAALVERLKGLRLEPQTLTLTAESDVRLAVAPGSEILFEANADLERVFSNLESVLSDPKLGLLNGGKLTAAVLDLRFGNKVFYRESGETDRSQP